VRTVFDVVRQIPGAPTPPPLDQCANPTIAGAHDGGIPGGAQAGAPATGSEIPATTGSGTAPSGAGTTMSAPGAGTAQAGGTLQPSALPGATTSGVASWVNPVNRSYATDQAVTVALHPGGAGVALPGLVLLAVLLVPPAVAAGLTALRRRRAGAVRGRPPARSRSGRTSRLACREVPGLRSADGRN
jgi:hypothetical protein